MKKIINQLKHNVAMSNDLAFSLNASMNKPCWRLFIRLLDAVQKDDTEFLEETLKKNQVFQSKYTNKRQRELLEEWLNNKVLYWNGEKMVGIPIFGIAEVDENNKVVAELNHRLEGFLLNLKESKGFAQIRSDLLMKAVSHSVLVVPLFINIYSRYMKRIQHSNSGNYTLFLGMDKLLDQQQKSYKSWEKFKKGILKPTLDFCKSIGWDVSFKLDSKKRVVNITCGMFPLDRLPH